MIASSDMSLKYREKELINRKGKVSGDGFFMAKQKKTKNNKAKSFSDSSRHTGFGPEFGKKIHKAKSLHTPNHEEAIAAHPAFSKRSGGNDCRSGDSIALVSYFSHEFGVRRRDDTSAQ